MKQGKTYQPECITVGVLDENVSSIPGSSITTEIEQADRKAGIVVFDVETTSFEQNRRIMQMSTSLISTSQASCENPKLGLSAAKAAKIPAKDSSLCKAIQKHIGNIVLRSCVKCGEVYHHMCQVADESGSCVQCSLISAKVHRFSVYILLEEEISPAASKVTALSVINGQLYHQGQPVQSISVPSVLAEFFTWLDNIFLLRVL